MVNPVIVKQVIKKILPHAPLFQHVTKNAKLVTKITLIIV